MSGATLLVMTDGRRECITRAISSLLADLKAPFSTKVIHDDSGDHEYGEFLWDLFGPHGFIIHSTGTRSGFAGAYRSAWQWLREHDRNDWIFSTEDDFVLTEPVEFAHIREVLTARPDIVQMALLRQPWSAEEKRAGGIIEMHPHEYRTEYQYGFAFRTHRKFFTTNPSVFRRSLICERDWPSGPESEGRFGLDLFASHPALKSAFWGQGVAVEHIGTQRVGTGY